MATHPKLESRGIPYIPLGGEVTDLLDRSKYFFIENYYRMRTMYIAFF